MERYKILDDRKLLYWGYNAVGDMYRICML
jgi:hypothetical protein